MRAAGECEGVKRRKREDTYRAEKSRQHSQKENKMQIKENCLFYKTHPLL